MAVGQAEQGGHDPLQAKPGPRPQDLPVLSLSVHHSRPDIGGEARPPPLTRSPHRIAYRAAARPLH